MKSNQGYIKVILGPMVKFSGKTSELMRLVKRFRIAEQICLIINYANDDRFSDEDVIKSHDSEFLKAIKVIELESVREECLKYDIIAIDEGQFFMNIAEFCEQLANQGKIIIVAALDGTFERKVIGNFLKGFFFQKFNSILDLIPLCEEVKKLNAVCWFCKQETASFTKRITEAKEIELIGGKEIYRPACRNCFNINIFELKRE